MDEYGNIIQDEQTAALYGDDVRKVEGIVEHIVFRNEENGYTVLGVSVKGHEVTCVGTFANVNEGEYIQAEGAFVKHPVYWKQFKVSSYSFKMPDSEDGVLRYLSSGAIKGVGAKTAQSIVEYFGADTFRIMEEEPERLAEIKGISLKKAMDIAKQLEGRRDMRQAMVFLQKYGISMNLSSKIYERYGEEIYQIIRENPYRLADDIEGLGFKTADEIAQKSGIRADSEYRVKSGILYTLMNAAANGHTYLPTEELTVQTKEMLLLDLQDISQYIMDLSLDKKIVVHGGNVYAASYYYMELKAAAKLEELDIAYPVDTAAVEKTLKTMEQSAGIVLEEAQKNAVLGAIRNGLMVITGGPGTGKTTIINTIIRYFELEGMDIRLAAPTGRAAKRMTETTGIEAQTIHRLLEITGGVAQGDAAGQTYVHFERNEQNPIEADVVIVDEMSMVDIGLMTSLLAALVDGTRLILAGDVDQLPSVGPGNVLRDIIQSGQFEVAKLTKIFRQSQDSEIITNAHAINRGELFELNRRSRDFLFVHRETPESIAGAVKTLLSEKLPDYVHADRNEIQVLTPTRKGVVGVEQLNRFLQSRLNPPDDAKPEKEIAGTVYRVGDKVMQTKNNYQIAWEKHNFRGQACDTGQGVFNGDLGQIEEIRPFSEEVVVRFDDGRYVRYPYKQMDELELAYAVTVHKSQGSEYPAVIIPMYPGPRLLMTRNLLYTAVTRAKQCVCLVGREDVFRGMIQNVSEQKRYSSLAERIREVKGGTA